MNDRSFDTLTRQAAGSLSRRASLLTLGAAGAVALGGPARTAAKKQSTAKKAAQKCQRQGQQCLSFFEVSCRGREDEADCLALAQRCCKFPAKCDTVGLFTCAGAG